MKAEAKQLQKKFQKEQKREKIRKAIKEEKRQIKLGHRDGIKRKVAVSKKAYEKLTPIQKKVFNY